MGKLLLDARIELKLWNCWLSLFSAQDENVLIIVDIFSR